MVKSKPWNRNKKTRCFKPFREIKQRFLIICEGKTEKNYFDGFKLVSAKVKAVDKKGKNALNLLTEAVSVKNLNNDYDQYWVVFDRDDQTNSYDQIIEAFNIARQNALKAAFSNQCFELWFLLHFQNVSSSMNSDNLEKKLDKFLPDTKSGKYTKVDLTHYEQLIGKKADALMRAAKLNFNNDFYALAKNNPSTTVNILVEELLKYIDE
jgi:hypothetical protein